MSENTEISEQATTPAPTAETTITPESVTDAFPSENVEGGQADSDTVDLNDTADSGRPYLPQQRYVLVCIGCEFQKSKSSGQPMLVLEWEVVSPKVVTFKNNAITVEGTKINEYASLQPQALGRIKTLHKYLGLPMTINPKAPDTAQYLGRALAAIVNTQSKVANIEGTNEPILDDNGKPVTDNQYRIARYLSGEPTHNRSIPY